MGVRTRGWTGQRLRRIVLVVLMMLAALVAPIAVPIRVLVARRRREATRTEQVMPEQARVTRLRGRLAGDGFG